jgi:putative ABC transport system permease protein
METILQDIRYALRALFRRNAAFTAVAIITLALGIGANTTIFSLVNSILLSPLPYEEPERLVSIYGHNLTRGVSMPRVSAGDFADWRNQNEVFSDISAIRFKTFLLTGRSEPEWISGGAVSASLFHMLGVKPLLGRVFGQEDEQPSRSNVALISHRLWQRVYGSDEGLVGESLTLDGQSYVVAGVLPRGFQFPREFDIWVPLTINPALATARRARFLQAVARLKDGVALDQAQTQMDTISRQLEQAHPDTNAGWGVRVVPLYKEVVGSVGRIVWVLFGAVGFVLLIACANIASLTLARAITREREVGIRIAIGAGRRRIIQHLLVESCVLAIASGMAGFLLSLWGVRALVALAPADIPRIAEVSVTGWVLVFTLVVSALTGVMFGLAPAVNSCNPDLSGVLKEAGRGQAIGNRRPGLFRLLVIFEVALAVVLLSGAGLMIKSFIRLQNVDPGFAPRNILTMRISLPESKYPEAASQAAFFRQLLDGVAALPGVESGGVITELPIGGSNGAFPFTIEGRPQPGPEEQPTAFYNSVSPDYFRAMGIPLVKGHYFGEIDKGDKATRAIIIDEVMARRYWPGEDPIGKRLSITAGKPIPHEVVGVVKAVKFHGLDLNSIIPAAYVSHVEAPQPSMALVIRTATDPASLAGAVREELKKIDKDQPMSRVSTMEQLLSESLSQKRFYTSLMSAFALIALVMAAVGIYGLMTYSVTQRTQELGVRMALGARPWDVIRLAMGQNLISVAAGALIGLIGAFGLTGLLSSLLYGITPTDPATFAAVVGTLLATALLACYLPARKATKVDPLVALRHE